MTVEITQKKLILRQASAWMETLRRDRTKHEAAFGRWLLRSPAHVEAFLSITALDEELRHIDPERCLKVEVPQETPRMTSRTTLLFISGAAAALLIAGLFWHNREQPQDAPAPGITHSFSCDKKSATPIEHCDVKDDGSSFKCDCVSQAEQDRAIAAATAERLQ